MQSWPHELLHLGFPARDTFVSISAGSLVDACSRFFLITRALRVW